MLDFFLSPRHLALSAHYVPGMGPGTGNPEMKMTERLLPRRHRELQEEQLTCHWVSFETSIRPRLSPAPPCTSQATVQLERCLVPHIPLHNLESGPTWDSHMSVWEGVISKGLTFATTLPANNRSAFKLPSAFVSCPSREHMFTKCLN